MFYELGLISVLIAASYSGASLIRSDPQMWPFGMMQLAAAVAAGLGLYHSREHGAAWLGVAGAVGLGAGACLLLIAPLARATARRFADAKQFKLAHRLFEIADRVLPDASLSEEKAFVATMRQIQAGNIDQSVATLTAARHHAHPDARRAIDERITMLYLAAYHWDEAIAHGEAHLRSTAPRSVEAADTRPSLRHALGVPVPLWVKLLGAYGYVGDLDQAARMLARLEQVCSGRDDASIWVYRARVMFLALAGRIRAVEALVAQPASKHMSRSTRAYWIAVAHERNGDAHAAKVAYAKARAHSRGARRGLIDRAIERLDNLQPVELTPLAKEHVDHVEQQAPPVVKLRERPRAPWATRLLTASMLCIAAMIALTLGDSSDIGVAVRAGAMVRGFVHDGEWWRLVSCNFVQFGGLHLLVNILGLWFLARECEHMFGHARTVAVFAVAGIAGFITSYLASPVGISAGASSAICGLLGAVLVELTRHKRHYRAAWSRGIWGYLVLIVIGQAGIDIIYWHVTDHYAHAGGALVGALLGAALSPHARWARASLWASRGIAAAFIALCAVAAIMVVRTPIAKSFGKLDHERRILPGLFMSTPRGWKLDDNSLHDSDNLIQVRFHSSSAANPIDGITRALEESLRSEFDRIDISTERVVPLPRGWDGRELAMSSEQPNGVGGRQHFRLIIAFKRVPAGLIATSIEVGDSIARAAPGLLTELVASIVVK
jgi:membrane associated rhomboid family serine protease